MEIEDRIERIQGWAKSLHDAFSGVHDELNELRDDIRKRDEKKPNVTVVGADEPLDIGDIKGAMILGGNELDVVRELINHWAIGSPLSPETAGQAHALLVKIGPKDPTPKVAVS